MLSDCAHDVFGELARADHDFPVVKRNVTESAFINDNVTVAQDFRRVVARQNIFPVEREESAVVHENNHAVARVLPNPIERGQFVQVAIEAADIVARVVSDVAEILFSLRVPRVNDSVAFGQGGKLSVFVRDDAAREICADEFFQQSPMTVDGGEVFSRGENISVGNQPIFKPGAAPHERQNIFRQAVEVNQRVDKFGRLAFGSQKQGVEMFKAAGVGRRINLRVKIFNRGIFNFSDNARDFAFHVGEHVIIVFGEETVGVKRARQLQRVNQVENLNGIARSEKIIRRVTQQGLRRDNAVNQL